MPVPAVSTLSPSASLFRSTVDCEDATTVGALGNATATDNCDVSVAITSGDASTQGVDPNECDYSTYTITRTFTAADECGNTSTCQQVITVQDVTNPTITFCPANVTVDCEDATTVGALGNATATDNCGMSVAMTCGDASTQDVAPC